MNDKVTSLQDRAVAQAVHQGVGIPDKYRVDGQLNCEMWALTIKVIMKSVST